MESLEWLIADHKPAAPENCTADNAIPGGGAGISEGRGGIWGACPLWRLFLWPLGWTSIFVTRQKLYLPRISKPSSFQRMHS